MIFDDIINILNNNIILYKENFDNHNINNHNINNHNVNDIVECDIDYDIDDNIDDINIVNKKYTNYINYINYIKKIKNNILVEISSSIRNINDNKYKNIQCDILANNILKSKIFDSDEEQQYKYLFYIIIIDDKYYIIKNFASDDESYTYTIYPSIEKNKKKVYFNLCNYIGNFINIYNTACYIEKNLKKYDNILNTLCNYISYNGDYKNIDITNENDKHIINVLNDNQIEALEKLTNNIEIIQGPPGTGKSTTIIGILQEKIPNNHKIICTCVQNQAIESLVMKLKKYDLNFVVFGNTDKLGNTSKLYSLNNIFDNDIIIKELNEKINKINNRIASKIINLTEDEQKEYIYKCEEKIRELYKKIMNRQYQITNNYDIYVGTIASSYSINNYVKNINTIIIDEAGYITEMDLLSLIVRVPKNIIMIGDHKQLRPFTYMNNSITYNPLNKKEYYISPFERLINNNYKYYTLNIQYRMDKQICDLVSRLFYNNKLITANSVKSLYDRPIEYHHIVGKTENINNSFCNLEEIKYIQKICDEYNDKHILILTFYSEQLNQIKKNILNKNIDIYTIDSSQGREADIVIISIVCDNYRKFLCDPNRLCVMLSRAKYKLIIVGQIEKFCCKSKLWLKIFNKINYINKIIKK